MGEVYPRAQSEYYTEVAKRINTIIRKLNKLEGFLVRYGTVPSTGFVEDAKIAMKGLFEDEVGFARKYGYKMPKKERARIVY